MFISIIIMIILAVIMLIIGIALLFGKGSFLIAGYNTMSDEEKRHYDKKKLCRSSGTVCIICAAALTYLAVEFQRLNTGAAGEGEIVTASIIFTAVIIATVVFNMIYTCTKCKIK